MPAGSSNKRERQYEHIKESYEKRGQKGRAEEIAARTVNKERAEHGETKSSRSKSSSSKSSGGHASANKSSSGRSTKSGSSRSSSASASSGSRSGRSSSSKPRASSSSRSGSGGERTRAQLYEQAKRQGVSGRSSMNKAQLERALSR
jgi:hypothetical protein